MRLNKRLLWALVFIVILSLCWMNSSSISTVLLGIKGTITDGNLIKFSGTAGVGEDAGVAASKLSNITKNKFDATEAPTEDNDVDEGYTAGSLWFDITNDSLYACFDNTDGAAIWMNHDISIKEENTSALIKGNAVYASDESGINILVGKVDNTNAAKVRVIGLAKTDIAQNGKGYAVDHGLIYSVDTRPDIGGINGETGVSWTAGDLLFVNSNAKLTSARPTSGRSIKAAHSLKGSNANDILYVRVIENQIWQAAASGEDVVMRMGDSAGANKISYRDYANNEVASMDSDGELLSANVKMNKLNATSAPTVNNDTDEGYAVGSYWVDVTADKGYICLDNTDGAAVWTEITQSGGGATFLELTDTPAAYDNGKYAKSTAAGLVWDAPAGYTNLTSFVDQTAWRLFYSNTAGDVTEVALGTSTQVLTSSGATSAPSFQDAGAAGETNTASNIGANVEIFKQKTGVDLELRTLKAKSNKMYVAVDSDSVEVGSPAINRNDYQNAGYTAINKEHPATADGQMKTIEIWAKEDLSSCKVASFYVVSGNNLSTRDYEDIGAVTAGSKQIFSVSIDVEIGDYIGLYAVAQIEKSTSGYAGMWYVAGDKIPCTNQAFSAVGNWTMSLYSSSALFDYIHFDIQEENIKLDDLGTPDDNTDLNTSTSKHGLMPKLPFSGDLLSTTTVAFNADADTTLYTVPTGKRCVLSHAIVVAAGDAGATTTLSIGANGTETDFIPANTLSNLDAQYDSVILQPIPNTTPLKIKSYAAATVIEARVASQSGAAGNTVYLFGITY